MDECWVVYYLDPWEHFVSIKSVWTTEDEARAEVQRQYAADKQGQHPDYRPVELDYDRAQDHRDRGSNVDRRSGA